MVYRTNKITRDPRSVARDIPGIFNAIFPQLTPGVITYFNKRSNIFNSLDSISDDDVISSSLEQAMLFEISYARAEFILSGNSEPDWVDCLEKAVSRQRYFFDAVLPKALTDLDRDVINDVATNLVNSLLEIKDRYSPYDLFHSPKVSGFQWIASGSGDFSIGKNLIEVKCTRKHFNTADYRQVLMYWLLSYASAIENDSPEWEKIIFINPRRNYCLEIDFDELIEVCGAGKSKIEILELFSFMIGDLALKTLPEFKV